MGKIGLGQIIKKGYKKEAAKDIAAQKIKAFAGEAKRVERSDFFGKVAGMGIGVLAKKFLLPALITAATGGVVNPFLTHALTGIVMGGSMTLGKHLADKATKSKHKVLKTPGQVDKIVSHSKYGYGEEEAETLTKALTTSRESTEQDAGTLGAHIASSIAFNMLSDKGGDLLGKGKEVVEEGVDTGEPLQESLFGGVDPKAGEEPWYNFLKKDDKPFNLDAYLSTEGEFPIDYSLSGYGDNYQKKILRQIEQGGYHTKGKKPFTDFAEGGQVPSQEDALMELLALVQPQQLEEEQQPSISDYFASQGKTLGGNNTQSLSQKLGR